MPVIGLLVLLGWIALGCCADRWLSRRSEDDADGFFLVLLLVYFGVPMQGVVLLS